MIKRVKALSYIITGFVSILIVSGVLFVWIGNSGETTVSADSRVYYKGSSETCVALMFNVYSGSEYIPEILKILDDTDSKATFFVGGSWVEKNESLLKSIHLMGHEIGNHGYLHRDHASINEKSNKEEILITHKLVKGILGEEMNLFAPPSGSYSSVTVDVADDLGYKTVMWSKDTIDWRDQDVNLILSRATSKLKAGDLVLMHPTEKTVQALPLILDEIRKARLTADILSNVL
ncbi:MAG: polysaccharide deacetylase family protein [Clostridia bacterium]|nr:polysaccharide deacetylase family protein [Clostridia bacterium]